MEETKREGVSAVDCLPQEGKLMVTFAGVVELQVSLLLHEGQHLFLQCERGTMTYLSRTCTVHPRTMSHKPGGQ